MVITEAATAWVIDTGVARFTINRSPFQGLSSVELRDPQGQMVVVSALNPGESNFILEHEGQKTTVTMDPWYLQLERPGPQVATVAARGFYADASGGRDLAYTIRIHFYEGSGIVRVEHTYYHGAVANAFTDGANNTTLIDASRMRLPLQVAATELRARADQTVHTAGPGAPLELEQEKRGPESPQVRFHLDAEGGNVEQGTWARNPFITAVTPNFHVSATIGRMASREPQALSWEPEGALNLEFTSTPMQVGGARGIWSVGAIRFALGAPDDAQADALQLHAERPLLGAPHPSYVNGTGTIGPYAISTTGPYSQYFTLFEDIHQRTAQYLEEFAVTGLQIWPDLPASSCYENFNCDAERNRYYEGGQNNYWNWSKPGIDEFFRTGDNRYIYDFSLGEAITFVETLAYRTDHDRLDDSAVMGLAPCYGSSRGFSGDYREGLNNRRDNCPADYTYDKTLKVAFLATGDRRFVDYFEEAGVSVIGTFGDPPSMTEAFLELNLARISEQRLELMSNAAEFSRDPGAQRDALA